MQVERPISNSSLREAAPSSKSVIAQFLFAGFARQRGLAFSLPGTGQSNVVKNLRHSEPSSHRSTTSEAVRLNLLPATT
jgi:hypothetical protein